MFFLIPMIHLPQLCGQETAILKWCNHASAKPSEIATVPV